MAVPGSLQQESQNDKKKNWWENETTKKVLKHSDDPNAPWWERETLSDVVDPFGVENVGDYLKFLHTLKGNDRYPQSIVDKLIQNGEAQVEVYTKDLKERDEYLATVKAEIDAEKEIERKRKAGEKVSTSEAFSDIFSGITGTHPDHLKFKTEERNRVLSSYLEDIRRRIDYVRSITSMKPEDIDEEKIIEELDKYPGEVRTYVNSFLKGIGRPIADIPQAAGLATAIVTGSRPEENMLFQAGQEMKEWMAEIAPDNPIFRERFMNKLAQGLGSATAFTLGGTAARAAKIPQVLSVAFMGASSQGVSAYEEALSMGATEEEAYNVFLWNAGIGTTETIPISRMFGRLDDLTNGSIKRLLLNTAVGGLEETIQEIGAMIASDFVAQKHYDEERQLFNLDALQEEGGVAFTVGTVFNALVGMKGLHRSRLNVNRAEKAAAKETIEKQTKKKNPHVSQEVIDELEGNDDVNIVEDVKAKDIAKSHVYRNSPERAIYKHLNKLHSGDVKKIHADPLFKAVSLLTDSELKWQTAVVNDDIFIRELRALPEKRQLLIRKGLENIQQGKHNEFIDINTAAGKLNIWFNTIKEDVKQYKRTMYRMNMPEKHSKVFDEALEFDVSALQAYMSVHKLQTTSEFTDAQRADIEAVQDMIDNYNEIDNWGIDNYITNMELGTFKLQIGTKDGGRKTVAVAVTKKELMEKARAYAKQNPNTKNLYVNNDYKNVLDQTGLTVDKATYNSLTRKIYGSIDKSIGDVATDIQNELVKELRSKIRVKGSKKFAGPLVKRKEDGLKGEENIVKVLNAYSYAIRKKIAVDPAVHMAEQLSIDAPDHVTKMIDQLIEDVKGRSWTGDAIVDEIFDAINGQIEKHIPLVRNKLTGGKPMRWSRFNSTVRSVTGKTKLGYRLGGGLVNFVGGHMHTWTATGLRNYRAAQKWIKTTEGRKFLAENEWALGLQSAIDVAGKQDKRELRWYAPLKLFSLAEPGIRKINLAANYIMAKENYGMSDQAAKEFAQRSLRFQVFVYNAAALPRIMRGPGMRTVTQFKTYMVKEGEFIASLRGKQIPRYVFQFFAMGGIRSLVYFMRSIPVLGVMGFINELEEELLKIPGASGLLGLTGGDLTPGITVQLPKEPVELLGPAIGDLVKFHDQVLSPSLKGVKYFDDRFLNWLVELSPEAQKVRYLFNIDDESYVLDPKTGKRLYRMGDDWDKALLAMGISPTELSRQRTVNRILRRDEEVRKKNAKHLTNDIISTLINRQEPLSETQLQRLQEWGVDPNSLPKIAEIRKMTPEMLRLTQARIIDKLRVIELNNLILGEEE